MNRTTLALGFGAFGVICTEFGIIGILPQIASSFQISMDKAGLLVSLFATVVAISGLFATLFTSRFEKRGLLLFSLAVFLLSNILSAFSDTFTWLLLARLAPAFFVPIYFANALVIGTTSVTKNMETKAIATVYAGLSTATVVGIPAMNYLANTLSWRASFWFSVLVNTIAWVYVWWAVPSSPPTFQNPLDAQVRILKSGALWGSMLGVCLIAAGSFSIYSYFAEYLAKTFHMDNGQVSAMLMLFGLAGITGNWFAGMALGKSFHQTLTCFITGMALTMLALNYMGINFTVKSFIISVWGIFHAAGFIISQVWISRESKAAPAFGNSLVISTANIGAAIGASTGGYVIEHYGSGLLPWVGLGMFALTFVVYKIKLVLSKSHNGTLQGQSPSDKTLKEDGVRC